MYSKADLDQIRELMQSSPFTGHRELGPAGEECKIKILGRGEVAFYQRGERALLMEILAGYGVIFADSIRRWNTGEKVSDEEREAAIEAMSRAMTRLGFQDVKIDRG